MDFFRFQELLDYWHENPPPHIQLSLLVKMVAALGGVKLPGSGGSIDASQVPPEMLAGLGVNLEALKHG